jgi:hypothetical protein
MCDSALRSRLLESSGSCTQLDSPAATSGGPAFAKFADAEWSTPVQLGPPISLPGLTTTGPFLSHDELSLYFAVAGREGALYPGNNIWVSHRASLDAPWETPAPVDLGGTASLPALSVDGHSLLFSGARSDCPNAPASCILIARRIDTHDDFAWGAPVPLGVEINQAGFHGAPSYMNTAEGGRTNLYFSANPSGLPAADANKIYSAAITKDGEVVGPVELVAELSNGTGVVTSAHASLSVDGKEVYFYSSRPYPAPSTLTLQHIWYSTRRDINSPWSPPVPASINAPGNDFHPSLSFDGRTLMWSSNRNPTGSGTITGRAIWMATRTPGGN